MNSTPVGSVRRMSSAALLSRSGQSETVSWQAGYTAKTLPAEGLFDSFLRRAGRAHSRKEPKSRLTMPGILQVQRDATVLSLAQIHPVTKLNVVK